MIRANAYPRPAIRRILLPLLGWCCISGVASAANQSLPTADEIEFFERQVRPLLVKHCYACHSADAKKLHAGLRVDHRKGLIDGGDSGESIVPGDPGASLFMEAVRYESYEMPPKGKLAEADIETFADWIRMGAPWPEEEAPIGDDSARESFDLQQRSREHWVWQPIRSPDAPDVKASKWPRAELDAFVLAALESNDLAPSREADREAILRRLYYDLIGLPPTKEQVAAFLREKPETAIEKTVDQLLESPRFGERWGRHWLDLVRYAESRGHEFDNDATNAFQYRDYIIRALNADVPYDQLVREHIAGDLVSRPRLHPELGFNESILGTGFWFLGEWVHSPVDIRKDESDRFDNMIDVMSKTFLGVTVSCARCHDHKFDAISTADYYSLTGFLQSSDFRQVRFESMESNRRVAKTLAETNRLFREKTIDLLRRHQIARPDPQPLPGPVTDLLVFDFQTLPRETWLQDGYIFGDGPRRAGDAWLDDRDERPLIRFADRGCAANDPIWFGLETISEPGQKNRSKLAKLPRSGRTLRTPTFELTAETVTCRVRGKGHVVACIDSHRMVAGPLHGETIKAISSDTPWVRLDLGRYVGHRIHLEFTPAKNSLLEVFWMMQGSKERIKLAMDSMEKDARTRPIRTTTEEIDTAHDKSVLRDELNRLAAAWSNARRDLRSGIKKTSRAAMAMMDGTGEDASVLIRGNASNPGKTEPRHFLTAVSGDEPMLIPAGSGRLELAAHINDPDNPLTSRVIVNRIWHHLLGRGIVPSTDDFGVLGVAPTNPDLLDHLASRFRRDGQSIKRLIRYIVLSRTYQMSSKPDPEAVVADPKNRLWHHCPPRRLQGEAIRDSLLTLSGRLDTTAFGESIPIHLTSFMDGRGRPATNGPLDGDGRRSIYVATRRNFLSPFMLAFDTPVPFSTMGRRNVSNVPAQSLILMNDPFVFQQAKAWSRRAMESSESTVDRIRWLYVTAFSRHPTEQEISFGKAFLDSNGGESSSDRWADFAHALVNTKEFIFLR